MTNEIKVQKSIFQNYAEFKVEFGKLNLTKSGRNEFQKFNYFELSDFSNKADEILLKHNLVYVGPTWDTDSMGEHWVVASLYSLDGMQKIDFRVKDENSSSSNNPIQNSGASVKYWRRYMKSLVCELIENDEVDSQDNSKVAKPVETKATKEQISIISELYDAVNIAKILQYYKVETLEELTIKQASQAIAKKKKEETNG